MKIIYYLHRDGAPIARVVLPGEDEQPVFARAVCGVKHAARIHDLNPAEAWNQQLLDSILQGHSMTERERELFELGMAIGISAAQNHQWTRSVD